ncbi:MAG TPA: hypothetical protein VGD60_13550, partial [Candidatus Acidoferrales bacterium]
KPSADISNDAPESAPPARRSSTGFRVFRPRLPARIEMRDERPNRIFFRGVYGQVTTVSGPWRTSGDWWREDAWLHDEWDIEVRLGSPTSVRHRNNDGSIARPGIVSAHPQVAPPAPSGMYCVYFDSITKSWFVRGMYD